MTVTSISYVVPLESTPVIITVPSLIPIIFPFSIFAIDESSTVQVTLLKSRFSSKAVLSSTLLPTSIVTFPL